MPLLKKIFNAIIKNITLFLLVTSPIYFIAFYKVIALHETNFLRLRTEGELLNLVVLFPFILLASFFNKKIFKIVLSISVVLMAFMVLIEIESLFFLDRYFSTDLMYNILATNPQETKEFLTISSSTTNILEQIVLIIIYIAYCALAIYGIAKMKFNQRRNLKCTSVILLALFPIYHLANHHRTAKNVVHNNTLSFIVNGLTNGRLSIQNNNNIHTEYTAKADNLHSKQLVVFVLGESETRNHLGIYGYHRNTTPLQRKLLDNKKIIVFNDVVTSEPSTPTSMRNIFFEQGYETKPRINIMNAFNNAGFKNYYIENQFVKNTHKETFFSKTHKKQDNFQYGYTLITNTLAYLANRYMAPNAEYDYAVVTGLKKILKQKDDKIFMMIHLKGSHFNYTARYPKSFEKFHKPIKFLVDMDNKSISKYGRRAENVNHYDNSILYNDYVLSEIIRAISTTKNHDAYEISIVYIPDHGEATARTGDGSHLLHGQNTDKDIYEIPLFLWTNAKFKQNHPDIMTEAQNNINSPYMTDQIGFSLFQLAGIKVYTKDKPVEILSKSLFSKTLNTHRVRKIGFKSGNVDGVDYDKILKPQKDLYK